MSAPIGKITPQSAPHTSSEAVNATDALKDTAPQWKAPVALGLGFGTIAVLIGTLGIWGTQTKIAGAVIASGMIQVESNRQVIQHPEGGVVGAILAKDGDRVTAGQVVLRFDDRLIQSELAIIEGQLFELLARKARLQAERDDREDLTLPAPLKAEQEANPQITALFEGQRQLFAARAASMAREVEQITEQRRQAQNQIESINEQLVALQKRIDLNTERLNAQLTLQAEGFGNPVERFERIDKASAFEAERGKLRSEIAQIKGQMAALDIQALKLMTTRREEAIAELRDLSIQEIELQERRLSTRETLRRMEVRAPTAGVIHGSEVFALQAVVSPAQPIMYVIPQDQAMVVQARIESIHIDQVHVGQEASLRFSAFDQRQTPELFGSVTKVSADVFTDEATGMSYYAAELLPKTGELAKLNGQTLLPGMPVETYIKTTERTPMSYLIKPLADYFNKAMREE